MHIMTLNLLQNEKTNNNHEYTFLLNFIKADEATGDLYNINNIY